MCNSSGEQEYCSLQFSEHSWVLPNPYGLWGIILTFYWWSRSGEKLKLLSRTHKYWCPLWLLIDQEASQNQVEKKNQVENYWTFKERQK
jgi:hypothetical protein